MSRLLRYDPFSKEGAIHHPEFIPINWETAKHIYKDPHVKQMFLGEPGLTEDEQIKEWAQTLPPLKKVKKNPQGITMDGGGWRMNGKPIEIEEPEDL